MKKFYFALPLMVLAACTQKDSHREPAQSAEQMTLERYYASRVNYDFLKYQENILSHKYDLASAPRGETQDPTPQPILKKQLNQVRQEARIAYDESLSYYSRSQSIRSVTEPTGVEVLFDQPWRQHHDEVIVHELTEFPLHNGTPVREVTISNSTAAHNMLQLTNYTASWDSKTLDFKTKPKGHMPIAMLTGSILCSHEAVIHTFPKSHLVPANKEVQFTWYDSKFTSTRPVVQLKSDQPNCVVRFGTNKNSLSYGFKIVPEDKELAKIFSPEKKGEVCLLPKATQQKKPAQFFLSPQLTQTTCPTKVENVQTLEDSLEGINAKIRLLTGKNLTPDYLKEGNPFAQLDYSQAPKLDAILISYLVFRADFGGQVIMQALRHHAERGALIRIAISDVISLGKDRQMLFDFQARYPNVKLLFYQYRSEGNGFKDWINSLHRTNHIKFFMTYSNTQESANAVILGGRNIHDGFIFNTPVSNYISPALISYSDKGDEAWARWEDFETLFTSKDLVNKLMSQFFSVFHADYQKFYIRQFSVPVEINQELDPSYLKLKSNEIYLRSMVSIPFKDDMLLEKTFIKLLDSAEKKILLSTPYFNITDNILRALERAADRGVHIEVITRLDLDGDTADLVLSDVNKKSINKIYDRVKVYEYTTKGKILHSKLVVVDDSVVMMGSVNLNLRSFYHDIENVAFIYSKDFNSKITKLLETYKKESQLLTEKQKTTWWKSILIKIIGTAL